MENTTNTIIKIDEKIKELSRFGETDIKYWTHKTYFSDIFAMMADEKIDIYYDDLDKWISEHNEAGEYMERAVAEGLTDFKNYNFYGHVQSAEYLYYLDELYNNESDTKQLLLVLLLKEAGIEEIEESELDYMLDEASDADRATDIEDLIEEYQESLEEKKEEI